jgi:hypothetical protein
MTYSSFNRVTSEEEEEEKTPTNNDPKGSRLGRNLIDDKIHSD